MKKKINFIMLAALFGLSCFSCSKKITVTDSEKKPLPNTQITVAGPKCIVYKTRADYSKNVPVILSADKSEIVSFPDVRDVKVNGQFVYPSRLEGGYLLDNRGIGPDVAYIKMTYEEYNSQDIAPQAAELFKMIIDSDPIIEMYDCGNRSKYGDPAAAMNALIRSGDLHRQKRLK